MCTPVLTKETGLVVVLVLAVALIAYGLTTPSPPVAQAQSTPLSVSIYGAAGPEDSNRVEAALDWLGLDGGGREALAAELAPPTVAVVRLLIENTSTRPRFVSEPHLQPGLGLVDGSAYRATLRTGASPGLPLPPGLGMRALVYAPLPDGGQVRALTFLGSGLPTTLRLDVQAAPDPAQPTVLRWSRADARALGDPFEISARGVTVWAESVAWPEVVLAVRNVGGDPGRFPIFADHMLHAAVFGADGTLIPLEPASVAPVTVGVKNGETQQYAFRSRTNRAAPDDAQLMVAVYRELHSERDLQGLGVYALP